ncbi:hypothetical protein CHS0354_018806 [Potamilus streckersoni]|uniref:Cytosol aminopeptidase n=1 Tax=Potamilus streckersoni TaxID=2493646 RepID=A0AAE0WBC6_9BIVA|nr:hypothetical protein CHS0354_018806 [Potamilus streckersoni]
MAAHVRCMRTAGFVTSQKLCRLIHTSVLRNKGLVLGLYEPATKGEDFILSKAAADFDRKCSSKLASFVKSSSKKLKKGGHRVLFDNNAGFSSIAVCCVGKMGAGFNEQEQLDEWRDNIRTAVAGGVRTLRSLGETDVEVDPCGDAEAAAEGCYLGLFVYDELKAADKRKAKVTSSCFTEPLIDRYSTEEQWQRGKILAEGQNWARHLMETPANCLTPTKFAEIVTTQLQELKCQVHVRDKNWIENKKMGSFLSVAKGSAEPPKFLEIEYKGSKGENHISLVGKGITFDSGGISIKPAADMDKMRADMGGAACTVGALYAVAKLHIPISVKAYIPLCENMPSGTATRPGDVVTAMNGKTIQVDNTDAEGRLILADALCYAQTFNPQLVLDMATLTGAIDVALGSGATGVFTNSTPMWDILQKASVRTGDRVWRMPLLEHYTKQVTESQLADVNNIGKFSRSGGACTAAAFLKEFVTNKNWLHLDIAGVMMNKDEIPYLSKGMSGRPTRTVVEFIQRLAQLQSS